MARKETTVTINKVTVSFLSVERTGPALGEGGDRANKEELTRMTKSRRTTNYTK